MHEKSLAASFSGQVSQRLYSRFGPPGRPESAGPPPRTVPLEKTPMNTLRITPLFTNSPGLADYHPLQKNGTCQWTRRLGLFSREHGGSGWEHVLSGTNA